MECVGRSVRRLLDHANCWLRHRQNHFGHFERLLHRPAIISQLIDQSPIERLSSGHFLAHDGNALGACWADQRDEPWQGTPLQVRPVWARTPRMRGCSRGARVPDHPGDIVRL